jgi:outer membrane protein assembly factor BamE (lipoprotein component of BamABCDE complex)
VAAGCMSVGRKLDQSKLEQIKKGETTRQEVVALIGSPDQVLTDASGKTIFTYTFVRSKVKGETYIPIYGSFAGGANVQTQMYQVTFGPDGKVVDYISSYGATESGVGASAASPAKLDEVESNKRPQ